jgi:uncharacterized membrane protein
MLAMEKTHWQSRYRSTMIIVLSILGSLLLFMLMIYVVGLSSEFPALDDPEQVAWLFRIIYGAAFLLGIGVIIGRRVLFSASRLMRVVEEGGLNRLVGELASKTILLAAVSELIALMGLALSLLTKSSEALWRLGSVGVVLLIYNLPRRSAWERTIENFSRLAYEE